jgi:O-antigen ligase
VSLLVSSDRSTTPPFTDRGDHAAVRSAPWWALRIALAVLVALAPALAPLVVPVPVAWVAALVVGAVLVLRPVFSPLTLAAAIIVATAIAESSLVPDAGSPLPAIALAVPLLAAVLLDRRRDPRLVRYPPRAVTLAALLYLGAMVLAIIAGALTGWRPNYPVVLTALVALGLGLGLVVLPHVASAPPGRVLLVATIVALGPLLVLGSLVLVVTGPVMLDGAWVGAWLQAELTVLGHPTGIVFARVTGPFARPAGAATILAVSMIALLGLRPSVGPRSRRLLAALLPVLGVALFLTQNRDGWLIVATAAGLLAAFFLWRERRLDGMALATGAVFLALLGAMSLNAIGANVRQDVATAVYGPAIAATIPGADEDTAAPIRGGTGLSGREYLWRASSTAIRERPVLGWGLGSDQDVVAARLDPSATRFVGLTSDSLYLVTATETGLLGLLALLAFSVTSLVAIARRLLAGPSPDAASVAMGATFVGLLAGGIFETYRLGWVVFPSFELALAVGLALVGPAVAPVLQRQPRPGSPDIEATRRGTRAAA